MHKPQFDGTPSTEEYRAYLALLLRDTFIGRAENLPLARATDRILAQDVLARLDVPSFDNSQMDGYALTAEGASRENRIFTVGREIPAGRPLQRSRASDDLTYPIMTGAPIPKGYVAVVPVEHSERIEYPDVPESFGRPSEKIRLPQAPEGQFIRRRGEDVVAGLARINVSLDTICPETFAELTRRDKLDAVLRGIDGAAAAGLHPIKINAVLMPGLNDTQAPQLLKWALAGGYQLRFIEQMPLDADNRWTREGTITAAQIRTMLAEEFTLGPVSEERGDSPAALWEVYPHGTALTDGVPADGTASLGRVGIIASVTESFCGACTRTRLTADGKIRSCLFSDSETDLLQLLRSGASDEELALRWREGMWFKPRAHGKEDADFDIEEFAQASRSMSAIGG